MIGDLYCVDCAAFGRNTSAMYCLACSRYSRQASIRLSLCCVAPLLYKVRCPECMARAAYMSRYMAARRERWSIEGRCDRCGLRECVVAYTLAPIVTDAATGQVYSLTLGLDERKLRVANRCIRPLLRREPDILRHDRTDPDGLWNRAGYSPLRKKWYAAYRYARERDWGRAPLSGVKWGLVN